MKKQILTLALVAATVFGTSNLLAQTDKVRASLSTKFARDHASASNVRWTLCPNSFVVQFISDGESYVAFYTKSEELVAMGRRIQNNKLLPLSIQQGLARERERCERKYGSVDVGYVFEMQGPEGTSYIFAIQTDTKILNFALQMDGTSILRKAEWNAYPRLQPEVLAAAR